jgi:signal transduction histidine kinase
MLLFLALGIGVLTLYLSNLLVQKIAIEEKKKMEIWAEAENQLTDPNMDGDLGFQLRVVKSNETIPAILSDSLNNIKTILNIDTSGVKKIDEYLQEKLEEFKNENDRIVVPVDEHTNYYVYYGQSSVLIQLKYYPFVVLGIVALFMLVSYAAFSSSTRAEQNKVWVGLAKETAHQLGTPISSLMGWVECLDLGVLPENASGEMRKDIDRLQIITERFSKIGSEPILALCDVNEVMGQAIAYMVTRSGKGVQITYKPSAEPILSMLNVNLFQWVVENLIKNSIDAMEGKGSIYCAMRAYKEKIFIDFTDTGKGIPRNQTKSIFKPGFTTKKRGWGLGLSLAKRIIHEYHGGDIFVKESIAFKKTTIRIILERK